MSLFRSQPQVWCNTTVAVRAFQNISRADVRLLVPESVKDDLVARRVPQQCVVEDRARQLPIRESLRSTHFKQVNILGKRPIQSPGVAVAEPALAVKSRLHEGIRAASDAGSRDVGSCAAKLGECCEEVGPRELLHHGGRVHSQVVERDHHPGATMRAAQRDVALDVGTRLREESQSPLGGQRASGPGDDGDASIMLTCDLVDGVADILCILLNVEKESFWNFEIIGLESFLHKRWQQSMVPINLWAVDAMMSTIEFPVMSRIITHVMPVPWTSNTTSFASGTWTGREMAWSNKATSSLRAGSRPVGTAVSAAIGFEPLRGPTQRMAMAKTAPEMSLRRVVIAIFRAAGSPYYDAAEAPSEVRESGTGVWEWTSKLLYPSAQPFTDKDYYRTIIIVSRGPETVDPCSGRGKGRNIYRISDAIPGGIRDLSPRCSPVGTLSVNQY